MTAPKPQSADLLKLASELSRASFDKMSHALGWPDTANARFPWGRRTIRWKMYARNGYSSTAADEDWLAAKSLGLASGGDTPSGLAPLMLWRVTPLGVVVVRLRLRAVIEAAALEVAQ